MRKALGRGLAALIPTSEPVPQAQTEQQPAPGPVMVPIDKIRANRYQPRKNFDAAKLAELERRLEGHDQAIKSLFSAIREFMAPPAKPRREIGFHAIAKEADEGKTKSKRK